MSRRTCFSIVLILTTAGPVCGQEKKYEIKSVTSEPPKELSEAVRKQLSNEAVQFLENGKLVCELWFARELPSDADAEKIKKGLTYRDLRQSQQIGAIRFTQNWSDYRKQRVKAGVYTMRLGFQPEDGDHLGKSQYLEFLLLGAAAQDVKTNVMDPKQMTDMSMKSIDAGHPGALMLFPNEKPAKVNLESRPRDHWVLNFSCNVLAAGGKGVLGFGLTLVGEADD